MAREFKPTWARWVALVCALAATAAGCTATSFVPPPELQVPPGQRDLVGTWQDTQGRPLPDGREGVLVIQAFAGSTSCTEQDVTVFMELSWPPNRRLDRDAAEETGDSHRYLRDTEGSLMKTDGQSDLDTDLPAAAQSTGINRNGNRLFAITAETEAIWILRDDDRVERWARLGVHEGCA